MRVVANSDVAEFIRRNGGRLYVWADLMRCTRSECLFFTASTDPPSEPDEFRRFAGGDFELFFKDGGFEAPPELRLQLSGRRTKRVSAYEGFSWVLADELPETLDTPPSR